MQRKRDWPEGWEQRLAQASAALRRERFDWPAHNCGLAVATALEAACGRDLAADLRPLCSGPLGAMRLLRDAGGWGPLLERAGFAEIPVAMARRGDVVALDLPPSPASGRVRQALGLAVDWRASFAGPDGATLHPLSKCRQAWTLDELRGGQE